MVVCRGCVVAGCLSLCGALLAFHGGELVGTRAKWHFSFSNHIEETVGTLGLFRNDLKTKISGSSNG